MKLKKYLPLSIIFSSQWGEPESFFLSDFFFWLILSSFFIIIFSLGISVFLKTVSPSSSTLYFLRTWTPSTFWHSLKVSSEWWMMPHKVRGNYITIHLLQDGMRSLQLLGQTEVGKEYRVWYKKYRNWPSSPSSFKTSKERNQGKKGEKRNHFCSVSVNSALQIKEFSEIFIKTITITVSSKATSFSVAQWL